MSKNVAEVLYECPQASRGNVVVADNVTRNTSRWDKILYTLMKLESGTIDWKAKFQDRCIVHEFPTNEVFKTSFEIGNWP